MSNADAVGIGVLALASISLAIPLSSRVYGGVSGNEVFVWVAAVLMVGVVFVCGYKLYANSDTKMRMRRSVGLLSGVLLSVALFLVAASDHGTVGDIELDFTKPLGFLGNISLPEAVEGGLGLVGTNASENLPTVLSQSTIATLNSSNILESTTPNFFADLDRVFFESLLESEDAPNGLPPGFRIFPDYMLDCFSNKLGPSLVDPAVSGSSVAAAVFLAGIALAAAVIASPEFKEEDVDDKIEFVMTKCRASVAIFALGLAASIMCGRIPAAADDLNEPEPDGHNLYFTRTVVLSLVVAMLSITLYADMVTPLEAESTFWDRVPKYLCAILAPISIAGGILLLLVQSDFQGLNDVLLNALRAVSVATESPFEFAKTKYGASILLDAVRPIIAPIFYGVLSPAIGVCSENFEDYQTGTVLFSFIGPLALMYAWRAASFGSSSKYSRLRVSSTQR